jgi:hypothetical protein
MGGGVGVTSGCVTSLVGVGGWCRSCHVPKVIQDL